MQFLPPAATNETFALLQVLSDPEKYKALLAELKAQADAGRVALEGAQAAQKIADDAKAGIVAEREALDRDKAMHRRNVQALESDREMFSASSAAQKRDAAATAQALKETHDALGLRTASIDAREKAVLTKEVELQARERALVEREAGVAGVLKELGPLAAKLGGKNLVMTAETGKLGASFNGDA